jgi:hypothetical protein
MTIGPASRVLFALEAVLVALVLILTLPLFAQVTFNLAFHRLGFNLVGAWLVLALLGIAAASAVLFVISILACQDGSVRAISSGVWRIAMVGAIVATAGFVYSCLFETLDESGFTSKSFFGPSLVLWAPLLHVWLTTRARHLTIGSSDRVDQDR